VYYQQVNIPQNGVRYYLKIYKITISHLSELYLEVRNLSNLLIQILKSLTYCYAHCSTSQCSSFPPSRGFRSTPHWRVNYRWKSWVRGAGQARAKNCKSCFSTVSFGIGDEKNEYNWAIVQPGGAIRDFEAIQACNEGDPEVTMVYTRQRAFKD
jgi:hypothetical protein